MKKKKEQERWKENRTGRSYTRHNGTRFYTYEFVKYTHIPLIFSILPLKKKNTVKSVGRELFWPFERATDILKSFFIGCERPMFTDTKEYCRSVRLYQNDWIWRQMEIYFLFYFSQIFQQQIFHMLHALYGVLRRSIYHIGNEMITTSIAATCGDAIHTHTRTQRWMSILCKCPKMGKNCYSARDIG